MLGFELIAAIALVVISAAICIFSPGIPLALAPHFWAGPGAFPFIIGFIIFLLSLIWVLDMLRKKIRDKAAATDRTPWIEEVFGPANRRSRLFLIAALTLIFVFILIPLGGMINGDYGFIAATFIFVFTGLKTFSDCSFKSILIISALTAICVFFTFEHALLLPMPR